MRDDAVHPHADHFPLIVHTWYTQNRRDLPWRSTTPWGVLVSEFMLQQTPVARVLPYWREWMERWPLPSVLAEEPASEAVRAWGRLGYPRRALRLHGVSCVLAEKYDDQVPNTLEELLALPGVGAYTARAVLAFAHQKRAAPVDINVRRVVARWADGVGDAPPNTPTREYHRVEEMLPHSDEHGSQMAAAVMELGALVCTSRSPQCATCPVASTCAWRAAGYPAYEGPRKKPQGYAGTDRQVRGRVLAVLREREEAVPAAEIAGVWPLAVQRERAVESLLADGLIVRSGDEAYALPG